MRSNEVPVEGNGEPETLLRARGLELAYGTRPVLRGVDIDVRAGEFWFFLGANASGKTTLLRAILGLIEPRAGTLHLHPEHARRECVGFTPQISEVSTVLPTTVREFVSLGAVGLDLRAAERSERLAWALERVGLEGRSRASLRALSGGQRRRALVARALVRRPHLLLLDEPTEGLDVASEDALLHTVDGLFRDAGMALLFVTHKLKLAARFATHVALFAGGQVRAGPRDEVLDPATVEAAFGVPAELLSELRL